MVKDVHFAEEVSKLEPSGIAIDRSGQVGSGQIRSCVEGAADYFSTRVKNCNVGEVEGKGW